jgi:catechol 2,3-dioxygenase-like lactoylglutathione lyase family enzyme
MTDRATPNLPSRDLVATSQFYARLGFRETFRDEGWLIVERGSLQIEFFPSANHNPRKITASCCIRVSDLDPLHQAFSGAGLSTSSRDVPPITSPVDQPWGLREFAVVDPDGNLLRCLSPLVPEGSKGKVTS